MAEICAGCDACGTAPCNGECLAEVRHGRVVHICQDERACFGAFLRRERKRTGVAFFGAPVRAPESPQEDTNG